MIPKAHSNPATSKEALEGMTDMLKHAGASLCAAAGRSNADCQREAAAALVPALKAAIMQQQASARQLCLLSFAAISDVSGAEKVHLPIIYPLSEIQNPFGLVFSDWLLQ